MTWPLFLPKSQKGSNFALLPKNDKIGEMPDIFIASSPQPAKIEGKDEVKNEQKNGKAGPQGQSPPLQSFPHHPFSPMASLMINPTGINFQDQDQGEEVILLLRRHWVTNVPWIFLGSLMFLVPFIFSVLLPFLITQLSIPILIVGGIFWYLLSFGYLFVNFLTWYFNAHLVTNKKVIDIDFHSLTYKEVASTHLDQIQDVNFRVGGVIRHIFDYGDVFIQTAGTNPNFDFDAVPKPAFVADKLTDLMATKGRPTL